MGSIALIKVQFYLTFLIKIYVIYIDHILIEKPIAEKVSRAESELNYVLL
jgi:uncharacterized membrane protein